MPVAVGSSEEEVVFAVETDGLVLDEGVVLGSEVLA